MFELIIQYGPTVLFYVLSLLAGLVAKHVVTLTGNRYAQGVISRAYKEIDEAVREVMTTYVAALKAATADGKLTDEEKAAAKKMAVDKFKANFGGSEALKSLANILGLQDVVGWVTSKVEVAVADNKYLGLPSGPQ